MKKAKICLAGNPNSGKTTIFNALTDSHQKVGNWPGVTVERKEGVFRIDDIDFDVVDLPGTYSLSAYSEDEAIARDALMGGQFDTVIAVVDTTNLERNLYMVIELLEMGSNVILDLNMMDMIKNRGWRVDVPAISSALGIAVVSTSARDGVGLDDLNSSIIKAVGKKISPLKIDYGSDIEPRLSTIEIELKKLFPDMPSRFTAIKLLEGDSKLLRYINSNDSGKIIINLVDRLRGEIESIRGDDAESAIIEMRYGFISGLVKECVKKPLAVEEMMGISDKIDKVVLNKWLGVPLFLLFMWLTFKLVFGLGAPITDVISSGSAWLSDTASNFLGGGVVASLVSNGIIDGVGSVISFLPNILLLFLALGFLEDCGYMARAAFVMDRFMHALGLHGKSFIPMVLGLGCNIPGIMACRTLESKKDRILTILINPFMSCSARLPIYVLFAGAFFPKHAGTVIFIMYIIGIIVAVLTGVFFKKIFFKDEVAPLIMELPPYRMPMLKGVVLHMWERSSMFVRKAGSLILICVVAVWFLSAMPFGVEYASSESWIAHIGKFIAPIFAPAGFGFWQASIALIFGIMAKEVVVGTLGTIMGVGVQGLSGVLPHYFTSASALAFMVTSLLYVPCIASIAVIKQETKSWAWMTLSIVWSFSIGWIAAVAFYQIGRLVL